MALVIKIFTIILQASWRNQNDPLEYNHPYSTNNVSKAQSIYICVPNIAS